MLEEPFSQRKLIGSKLKEYIRSSSYTKASFSSKANISKKTDLDKILNSEADDENIFVSIVAKMLKVLNMTEKEILLSEVSSTTKIPENVSIENNMSEK